MMGERRQTADNQRHPWWRRGTTWAIAMVVVVLGAGGVLVLTDRDSLTTSTASMELNFAEVQRTTLEDVTTLDGTLGFVSGDPLVYAGSSDGISMITAGASGTITSLPAQGSTVSEGEILYTVDEKPVIVLYGEIPAYRTLNTRTADGTDVLQLEMALTRLGYDEDGDLSLNGDFTTATRDAIKALQDDLGIEDSGALLPGSYIFVHSAIFVADTMADVGSTVTPGMPVIATSTTPGGTVTALAAVGAVLSHADTLFVVEDSPVTLFVTSVPFYRTLSAGSIGADVEVLKGTLIDLGFDAGGELVVNDVFDDATTEALLGWQRSIGAPVDGVLNIGEIMVTENPIRIAATHISVGSTVRQGTAVFTPSTSTSVVSIRLPAGNQGLLVVGDQVTVVMPNGDEEPASVTSVGAVAIRSQEFGTYFEVEATLDRQGAATGLDEAPVDVQIVDDRAVNVLAVPVTALVALAEGGYAVEVDIGGGQTRLVQVEAGMYADSSVEITSSDLEVGMMVVVP